MLRSSLLNLWFAQHVSGTIMPIFRSWRLYRYSQLVAHNCDYGWLQVWCVAVVYESGLRDVARATHHTYEGVSKSPRTLLITRKSLVVHEFPTRVCWGGVLWVSVPSGVVGCRSVWLLHVSLWVYCISRLRFSDIGGMAEVTNKGCASSYVWDWVKREVKLLKGWNRLWWFVYEP